ncbi:MAG TPA: GNAT family N-acetyltransferase, partial [Polyangiaceae bacterium]|nr:GNAT family N-acetyltransferase [Polyangiaceae bacterium]
GNSVWTNHTTGALGLEARIQYAESFYATRGLPARFHLSPLAPAGLDAALAERLYQVDAPVNVQTAPLSVVLDGEGSVPPGAAPAPVHVQISHVLEPHWFELAGRQSRFADTQQVYRGLLERLGERATYALALLDGRPAGTSVGVLEGEWLGVHSMLTQPEFRRRGVAQAMLYALARSASARGAERLYLQVEQDNRAALRAYAKAGFETAYATHYRAQPTPHGTPGSS